MSERPPYYSIALVSALALAYEILLMRLFSIIQWHHFAFMVIALALLGHGASGTLIAINRQRLLARYSLIFCSCVALFAISTPLCFIAAQSLPFNAEEMLWDVRQGGYLFAIFVLLALPFMFAASAICLTFMQYPRQLARIYSVDLVGAGLGSVGIVGLLFVVFPQTALMMIGASGLLALIIATYELQLQRRVLLGTGTILIGIIMLLAAPTVKLNISPYKALAQTLRISDTRVIMEQSSPLGLLSVVESATIPLRHAPGLSLNATLEPLLQLGVFTDGDNMTVITRVPNQIRQLAYLDQMTSALPYHLQGTERVLVLGAGGGADVLQAQFHGARTIDAVELNTKMIELVNNQFADYSGSIYKQDNVKIHTGEARDYLSRSNQQYDLIQIALLDSFNASASGLTALSVSYMYTIEALALYIDHLAPGGLLAITRWIKMPPRDTLKLFATAIDALHQSGMEKLKQQLVLIRSWQTSTLLIKNGVFLADSLKAIRIFTEARSFDLAYAPGLARTQANRYNVLKRPLLYDGAVALLGEQRETFLAQYKFNLQPATDNRPYFYHFFKWSTLPEILSLKGRGGMPLLEWGYLVFIATLLIATVVSIILILLPLYFYRRIPVPNQTGISNGRVVYYFFAIGLAFVFIEIAFIQKFILFLHHPIYAIAVSLFGFLVFAGLGSLWSNRIPDRSRKRITWLAVCGIVLLSVVYMTCLDRLFGLLMAAPASVKNILSILLIAPIALLMGMPFIRRQLTCPVDDNYVGRLI